MKTIDGELQTLFHKQDQRGNGTGRPGERNSGACPRAQALLLLCCVFARSVPSYLYPFLLILFPMTSWQPSSPSNIKSRMTSSVKPSLTHLENQGFIPPNSNQFHLEPVVSNAGSASWPHTGVIQEVLNTLMS